MYWAPGILRQATPWTSLPRLLPHAYGKYILPQYIYICYYNMHMYIYIYIYVYIVVGQIGNQQAIHIISLQTSTLSNI